MADDLLGPGTEATYREENYEEGEHRDEKPGPDTGANGVHGQSEEVESGGLAEGEQQEDEADESKADAKRGGGEPSGSVSTGGLFAVRRP